RKVWTGFALLLLALAVINRFHWFQSRDLESSSLPNPNGLAKPIAWDLKLDLKMPLAHNP
ncbi:MAG: hypothetical protein WB711_00810, partial [Terriglobales bacterium]